MLDLFQTFIHQVMARLRGIARRAADSIEVADLRSQAWIAAHEIGEKRGKPVDFADQVDQELILSKLYSDNVRRGDWNLRSAMRHLGPHGEDDVTSVFDAIAGVPSADPLIGMLDREEEESQRRLIEWSYSQAVAYLILLDRFRHDLGSLALALVITRGTLNRRIRRCQHIVRRQRSLFDGVERVRPDFDPLRWRPRSPVAKSFVACGQDLLPLWVPLPD